MFAAVCILPFTGNRTTRMTDLLPKRRLVVVSLVGTVIICIIVWLSLLFIKRSKESQDNELGLPYSTSSVERDVETWNGL
jgi:hypothetical protein